MLVLALAAAAVLGGGAAAQPDCPPGTTLVYKYEDFDITDPSTQSDPTPSCMESGVSGEAPAPQTDCPPGTTAVQGWVSADPEELPTLTTTCVPTATRRNTTQPFVTVTLDGGEATPLDGTLKPKTPPALAPCAEGLVRLTPAAAKCTPW